MTFTASPARKYAEAARRNAIRIELVLDGADPEQPGFAELDAERRDSTRIWNDFCSAESVRLQSKDRTFAPAPGILPGPYVAAFPEFGDECAAYLEANS